WALNARSAETAAVFPFATAKCSGVHPPFCFASLAAPATKSADTSGAAVSAYVPCITARWRAVRPSSFFMLTSVPAAMSLLTSSTSPDSTAANQRCCEPPDRLFKKLMGLPWWFLCNFSGKGCVRRVRHSSRTLRRVGFHCGVILVYGRAVGLSFYPDSSQAEVGGVAQRTLC